MEAVFFAPYLQAAFPEPGARHHALAGQQHRAEQLSDFGQEEGLSFTVGAVGQSAGNNAVLFRHRHVLLQGEDPPAGSLKFSLDQSLEN